MCTHNLFLWRKKVAVLYRWGEKKHFIWSWGYGISIILGISENQKRHVCLPPMDISGKVREKDRKNCLTYLHTA